jgi:prepilin-type N-terminal cleavage/methylation domain-containing protein
MRADDRSRSRPARGPGGSASGFTLHELLVVMSLIGMLMGLGVGFLRRTGDDFAVALASVRDALRVAQLTARTRHLPAEVVIDPGQDGPGSVRARVLEPVGHWHMEEDPRDDESAGLPSVVTGTVEPGRFGMARRPDPAQRAALVSVQSGERPVFDLRDGFALRVDLRLEQREPAVIARLGEGFVELRLDADLVPAAKLVGTEGGGRPAGATTLTADRPLGLGRWHTLEIVHDRTDFRMLVDGREVARTQAFLPVLQTATDRFEVSPADAPVAGLCDEVMVMAYTLSPVQTLPTGLLIEADPWVIRFEADGELAEPARFEMRIDEDVREYRVAPGGVIE